MHFFTEMKAMKGVPILVLANKQDLPGAASADKLTDLLALSSTTNRRWMVRNTVATSNDGLREAIEEFSTLL